MAIDNQQHRVEAPHSHGQALHHESPALREANDHLRSNALPRGGAGGDHAPDKSAQTVHGAQHGQMEMTDPYPKSNANNHSGFPGGQDKGADSAKANAAPETLNFGDAVSKNDGTRSASDVVNYSSRMPVSTQFGPTGMDQINTSKPNMDVPQS